MIKTARTFLRPLIKTTGKSIRFFHDSLSFSPNVRHALETNKPVVALESTIFTHGLPYPNNYKMAMEVERLIHENGAVPATIGFVDGVPTVGLSDVQIELLANPDKTKRPIKVSRRDIPHVMMKQLNGGTTIAGTMILAQMAGIKVFATGGLGGVHRGASTTFDISADLDELARTKMAVVCSGPKSILDVPKTIEYLETKGVYVTTYGPDGTNVPGFFTTDSGVKSPYNFSSAEEAADIISLVFCVPSPKDIALPKGEIDNIIDDAVQRAEVANIQGKESTPFLLNEIWKATKGKTLDTNVGFVKNNAIMAAKIAVSLAGTKVERGVRANEVKTNGRPPIIGHTIPLENGQSVAPVYSRIKAIVIGALALDITCNLSSATIHDKSTWFSSNPGQIVTSIGGVAHNIAVAASYRGLANQIKLISEINQQDGSLLRNIAQKDIITDDIRVSNKTTAKYIAMHDKKGQLLVACADMMTIEKMDNDHISECVRNCQAKVIAVDANMAVEQMTTILKTAKSHDAVVMVEPTSVPKAKQLARIRNLGVFPNHWIDILTPNHHELEGIFMEFRSESKFDVDNWFPVIDGLGVQGSFNTIVEDFSKTSPDLSSLVKNGIAQQCLHLLPFVPNILVKLGEKGVVSFQLVENISQLDVGDISGRLVRGKNNLGIVIQHFPAKKITDDSFISATGAGDTLFGSLLADISLEKWDLRPGKHMTKVIDRAQQCSALTVQSREAVNPEIKNISS